VTHPALAPVTASLADYPNFSPFVLDWLRGEPRALALLQRPTTPVQRPSPSTVRSDRRELVEALISSNASWGIDASQALRRWERGQSVAIIAGQQVGFAGGPLYTFAKIASLLKIKQRNEAAGVPTTVFFWLATEDHDFDEVASVAISRPPDLVKLRARSDGSRRAVGDIAVPERLISEFLSLLGIDRPDWLASGIAFRDSFATLVGQVFGHEVVLVDALLPPLRKAGRPLLVNLIERWDDVQRSLRQRAGEIEAAGYSPQVTARDGEEYTLLFAIDHRGQRAAVQKQGGRWLVGSDAVSEAEIRRRIEEKPESISTAALTRPLLQDLAFSPAIFVGGPAEVSYCAQLGQLYHWFGIASPRVALRGHTLLAPQRALRVMQRFDVTPREIFSGVDAVLASRETDAIGEIDAAAKRGHEALGMEMDRIRDIALPADHALARSIRRSIGHIEYHFARLVERAGKAVARHDRERYEAVRKLVATLAPDGIVQDRIVSWFPFWQDGGDEMRVRVIEAIEPDSPTFNIVGI
jgi:bacillithiol biosynthesis cysteine-adding enzyme BshC